jgi:hypothetical protein
MTSSPKPKTKKHLRNIEHELSKFKEKRQIA